MHLPREGECNSQCQPCTLVHSLLNGLPSAPLIPSPVRSICFAEGLWGMGLPRVLGRLRLLSAPPAWPGHKTKLLCATPGQQGLKTHFYPPVVTLTLISLPWRPPPAPQGSFLRHQEAGSGMGCPEASPSFGLLSPSLRVTSCFMHGPRSAPGFQEEIFQKVLTQSVMKTHVCQWCWYQESGTYARWGQCSVLLLIQMKDSTPPASGSSLPGVPLLC